jgi:hypothetical protein
MIILESAGLSPALSKQVLGRPQTARKKGGTSLRRLPGQTTDGTPPDGVPVVVAEATPGLTDTSDLTILGQ